MTTRPGAIRKQSFDEIGTIIQRDAGLVIERWSRRVAEEQPNAQRVHHQTLLDHFPDFLQEMGHSLAESGDENANGHTRPARKHGEQRWEVGWSLAEVVQDYQLLRLVLVEYLEEALARALQSQEVMALGLALDEAIAASVAVYVRQRDEEQRQQTEALKEADRRKDEFLAMLAHELRNPLAPISNALQVLVLGKADVDTVEWVRGIVTRQVKHLTHLVDDLLDLSRIARDKVTLRCERLDLAQMVRTVAEDRRANLAEAGLTLHLDVSAEPLWVEGDATRLSQVVGNLLHNAGKFTDRGGSVTVRVARDANGGRAAVTVLDTGIGIEPGVLSQLFDPFVQADRSLERSRGGLGLGLALVKGLTELHGGQVTAASKGMGHGAEFTVNLPLAEAPPTPAGSGADTGEIDRLRILVIEDNRDSADSLKMLLELLGHRVTVAYSGLTGLETARREKPDVVLCDLGMPGMSGYEVAAAVRADPATTSARLIAVSGHGSEADQQRCREVGFDLHLTKPVDPAEFQRILGSAGGPASP